MGRSRYDVEGHSFCAVLQIIWLHGFRSYYSARWSIDESHGLKHFCSIVFQEQIRMRGVVWQGFYIYIYIYKRFIQMALTWH